MPVLQLDVWPPEPLTTERLVVRAPQLSDRARLMVTTAGSHALVGTVGLDRRDADRPGQLVTEIARFVEFDAAQGLWRRALITIEAPCPLTLTP